jgi:alpha-beta hydrolase superfamily lysophospholipase
MIRAAARWLGRIALLLAVAVAALWGFGPREPEETGTSFDSAVLGGDLDAYFAAQEARYADVKPEVRKRVVWAGAPGAVTPLSVLYVHGFSATSEEIRPVPDRVAAALGANLVYTRLRGHGRDGAAMTEGQVPLWMQDVAEALAAARAAGQEVIVIATSTGATLAAIAATDPALAAGVRGMVLVSPNFALQNPLQPILTWPAARWWLPLLAGAERSFAPMNAAHGYYWTTRYPTVALPPMAAAINAASRLDYAAVTVPALFIYAREDQVVDPSATEAVMARWGGPAETLVLRMGPADDRNAHVVLGDIMSPGQTAGAVARVLSWVRGL